MANPSICDKSCRTFALMRALGLSGSLTIAITASYSNRVVEVAGVDRVDRDNRLVGEIQPPFQVILVELLGLLAGLGMNLFGKFVGETEFVNDRKRVDTRLAAGPENFREHSLAAALMA